LAKIVIGAIVGGGLAVLILWYGFGRDLFGIFAPDGRSGSPTVARDETRKSVEPKPKSAASQRQDEPAPAPQGDELSSPSAKPMPVLTPALQQAQTTPVSDFDDTASPREAAESSDDTTKKMAAASAVKTSTRHPPPGPDAFAAKLKELQGIFEKDYANATNREARTALAASLLQFANDVTDDPDGRFVVLREALKLSAESGNLSQGETTIRRQLAEFELDEGLLRASFLIGIAENLQTNEERSRVAADSLSITPVLARYRHIDEALSLAESAQSLALRSENISLRTRAREEIERLKALQRELEIVAIARKTLEENP
jgi:hypothetical protein